MKDERNYHIFYCMLAGLSAEEKSRLELKTANDYFYLMQVCCLSVTGTFSRFGHQQWPNIYQNFFQLHDFSKQEFCLVS